MINSTQVNNRLINFKPQKLDHSSKIALTRSYYSSVRCKGLKSSILRITASYLLDSHFSKACSEKSPTTVNHLDIHSSSRATGQKTKTNELNFCLRANFKLDYLF